jgi:tubulin--tyrosine ligase-like protein 12
MSVTNQLDMIVRLPESGAKIACKYISTPLLLTIPDMEGNGVKFDVRYVLLLRSVRPLKLYVQKIFWLRFANKPFSLEELDDYETHFTVMNYRPNAFLRQMNCQTFISMFDEQYAHIGQTWPIVEQRIFRMFREVFQCATIDEPPLGIGSCLSSRALYAADIMLNIHEQTIQPTLLEINFTPDCHRACTFYPNFFNQVFNVLFRDIETDQDVIDISE